MHTGSLKKALEMNSQNDYLGDGSHCNAIIVMIVQNMTESHEVNSLLRSEWLRI